jgi:DNA invertase Pin-like site-specific DNA recombinase
MRGKDNWRSEPLSLISKPRSEPAEPASARLSLICERNSSCRGLLVEKTDRLYRNFRDWVTIDEIRGLEVHFVKEATVISEESRSSEKFIHGIKVLMAKNFIDNLSEETRKGMVEKASQGIWPSYAPIGYLNADGANGKRTIKPDPALAPLV